MEETFQVNVISAMLLFFFFSKQRLDVATLSGILYLFGQVYLSFLRESQGLF